jgi:hypothetical protein
VSLFRQKAAPGLQTGLTDREWDAMYGETAQRLPVAQFKRAAWISAVLLGTTLVAMILTDGPHLPRFARLLIGALGMASLIGFTFNSAMLVGPWLMQRYGTPLELQQSTVPRRRRHQT